MLNELVGRRQARQILLAADAGASDEDIAVSVGVGGSTVYRTKRRFVVGNLEEALSEEPRPLIGKRGSPAGRGHLFQPERAKLSEPSKAEVPSKVS